jgi:hypothetical protein
MKSFVPTTITSLCFLTLLSISAYSQVESIDVLVAPGLTVLRGNSFTEDLLNPRVRLSGGIGVNYRLTQRWLVSAKLLYEDKGGGRKFDFTEDGMTISGKARIRFRYKYLTLPITAGYEFGNKVKFRAEAGPYIAFLMKAIFTSDADGQPNQPMVDETDNNKRVDFGLSAGIRALIPLSEQTAFSIGVHDNLGLFNVSAHPIVNNGSIKTNFLALSLGLCFKLN